MLYDTTKLAVCTVCICLLANGEYNDGTDAADKCSAGQLELWGDNARHLVPGGGHEDDADNEPYFSWSSCDGCGDTLGGDRHEAFAVIPYCCEYCDQPAERIYRDGGDLLCLKDAKDLCGQWRTDTSTLTERTLKMYGKD